MSQQKKVEAYQSMLTALREKQEKIETQKRLEREENERYLKFMTAKQ